jgi:2-phosphosulfolactate phosphatase
LTGDRVVAIDVLPEAAAAYGDGWAVVAVDVLRATTTGVTAVAAGRRCLPVPTLDAAREVAATLERPLLVGEVGGELPAGFDLQNSPRAMAERDDVDRPVFLLSSSGTRLLHAATRADATYAACLRNVRAQVEHLVAHHPKVAVIGAGTKGEFRREDQLGCARIAAGLLDAGHAPADRRTAEVVEQWRDAPTTVCADGRSAEYLRRTGQEADLEFVLDRVDDLTDVVELRAGELRRARA